MKVVKYFFGVVALFVLYSCGNPKPVRSVEVFNNDWKFSLTADSTSVNNQYDDAAWRVLNLPHDWSIEGEFEEKNPAGVGGGALPGGLAWYRKSFPTPKELDNKKVFIEFDGIYHRSDVWLNGVHLGYRPNGYISFRYALSDHLKSDGTPNVLVVKVDNSKQPNSRWYSGSGIYRNVRLVIVNDVHVDQWGTFITTPQVSSESATTELQIQIVNSSDAIQYASIETQIIDPTGKKVADAKSDQQEIAVKGKIYVKQDFVIAAPALWSIDQPNLYKGITRVHVNNEVVDEYETTFGIRYFEFDVNKGFSLNGKATKILGVCLHHDLGALGAAVNTRAIERQLEIMQGMGVNAIRTSHNPPTPELLDLCDKMGLLVMDEMFDMWALKKSEFDYSLDWEEWHEKDLTDFIVRDRNHPSIIMWSIGNEIVEQYSRTDTVGRTITRELAAIVRKLDTTRPITTANNDTHPHNQLIQANAVDVIGYNYHHEQFEAFQKDHPGKKFIVTESTSAIATRGHYDMPSDSIRRWPLAWDKPFTEGNADNTVSAYDNVSVPWGSTHEETWKLVKKHDFISGMFIWTGFDYLGEPTPYGWPSRSSYFGVVDLAGFPKDTYYMYKSEWTQDTVLHVYPHWNWEQGKLVDVWAYYNHADEVELFLNGKSLGVKQKQNDDLHVQWRVPYEPGVVKAVSRKAGKEVLVKEIITASAATRIILEADRTVLNGKIDDLSFITAKVVDAQGVVEPNANNLITFTVAGDGFVAAVDNGDPTSHESFRGNKRKAFHGLALAIVQTKNKKGKIEIEATAEGLEPAKVSIVVK